MVPNHITIILLDDDAIAREGVAVLFRARPEFHVLATSVDLETSVQRVHQAAPGVVLLNLSARGQASLTLIGALRRASPRSNIIIMGMKRRHEDVASFVRAGVSGFTMAEASFDDLVETIRSVARKDLFLPPELNHALFGQLVRRRSARRAIVPLVKIGLVDVGASLIPAV